MHRDALISVHTHSWFGNKVIEGNLKALFLKQYGSVEKLGTGGVLCSRGRPSGVTRVVPAASPAWEFTTKVEL